MEMTWDQRAAEREAWQAWKRFEAYLITEQRQIDSLATKVKHLAASVLRSAGYHQHARGIWRKKRRGATSMSADASSPSSLAALTARIQVAQRSDEDAAAFFDDFATASQVGENLLIRLHDGDLVRGLEQALIDRIEREDHLRREAIKRSVAQLRRDLSGSEPCSAVERLIIDRIIICWLAVQDAESRVIRTRSDAPQVAVQKRLDHAQNRLLAVIKALDHLRRKTPSSHRLAIQVVGDVHLNMPTAAPPAPVTGPTIELPASSEEIDHASTP